MKDNPYREDREQIRELLKQYENLKNGRSHSFIEEESFEKIINYYQEKDDLVKALEAAENGSEQYPYSSLLLVKQADILIANRSYQKALKVLEQASLLDSNDINLYILNGILETKGFLSLSLPFKLAITPKAWQKPSGAFFFK